MESYQRILRGTKLLSQVSEASTHAHCVYALACSAAATGARGGRGEHSGCMARARLSISLRNTCTLSQTFGFSEMSAVARFGTSEISVQARFRVRTFFRCAQVKNFFGLECPVSMVVVQPQDLSNWHAKGLKKYLLPQQALFCGNAGHTVW